MELPTEHKKAILNWIKDVKIIKKDIEQAQSANVPNVELLLTRCEGCIDYLSSLKKGYIDKK